MFNNLDVTYHPSVIRDLDNEEYMEAISDLIKFSDMEEQDIQEAVADAYSLSNIEHQLISDEDHSLKNLNKPGFNIYLTTNYDQLIQKYIEIPHCYPSLLAYNGNMQRIFSNQEKCLFHIHGSVSNHETIVLSQNMYNNLYDNPIYNDKMKAFTSSHSFLFIGFSFKDEFIQNLMKQHKSLFKGNHFWLLSKGQVTPKEKSEFNTEYGIKIIEYDIKLSSHAEQINSILDSLEDIKIIPEGITFSEIEEGNQTTDMLFIEKLEIEDISDDFRELSISFYLAAEKFIRRTQKLGVPMITIESLLAEVLLMYKDRYLNIFKVDGHPSQKLLRVMHEDLESLNITPLLSSKERPMQSEIKGIIHLLAEDKEKNVWWGDERCERGKI